MSDAYTNDPFKYLKIDVFIVRMFVLERTFYKLFEHCLHTFECIITIC